MADGVIGEDTGARLPVSVIVPAYNRAHMLERCLTSVGAQRPAPPAEVIVIDDGSADHTAELAAGLGATVIRHPHNRGLSAARNTGLRAASHAWVALLDSDDEWLPHHLAHLWGLRDGHVFAAASSLSCGADPAADRLLGLVRRRPLVLHRGGRLISPGNPIVPSAALLQRDLALAVGGFQSYQGVVEDLDMWLRLLERGSGICSPEVTTIYHLHDVQMSQDRRKMRLATLEAAEAHRERAGESRTPIRRFQGVAAWDSLRSALNASDRRGALRWGLRIAAQPQSVVGLLSALVWRHRIRRRSASLRAAGIGPRQREASAR